MSTNYNLPVADHQQTILARPLEGCIGPSSERTETKTVNGADLLSPPSIFRRPSGTDSTLPSSVLFFHSLGRPMTRSERNITQQSPTFHLIC